ncbi:MAG: hypothetical protein V5A46_05565 [Haloferacaceae archaeon]
MNRRTILARSGLVLPALGPPALLAGCLDAFEGTVRLCEVSVHNNSGNVHTVDLQILEGEETVHDERYELGPPEEGYTKDVYVHGSALESAEGAFSIRARRGDGEWKERFLGDRGDAVAVRIFVREQERLPDLEIAYITGGC